MYTREQAEQVLKDWLGEEEKDPFARAEINKFLDDKFPKLKNGMWVKCVDGAIVYITDITNGSGYGFDRRFSWEEEADLWTFDKSPKDWRPATDEEVIEALEKYAKSIGLVEGARVRCFYNSEFYTLSSKRHPKPIIDGGFWMYTDSGYGIEVMQNGEWATPIKSDLHDKLAELQKQAEAEGMKLVVTFENK